MIRGTREQLGTLTKEELLLFRSKQGLVEHYARVHRATLVDLQVYQRALHQKYQLPDAFEIDLTTGAITVQPKVEHNGG